MIDGKSLFAEISNEPVCEDGEVVGYYVKNSRMNELERLLTTPAPVAVPDEWRSVLQEMVNAMLAYEMDVGEPAPYKHRKMMMRAGHLLESHRAAMQADVTLINEVDNHSEHNLDMGKAEPVTAAMVPDGWKLVPVEPTERMVIDGFESEPDETFSEPEVWEAYQAMSGCRQAAHRARLCYAAMLAASPAAPEQEV